ncbi:hypothetical protein QJS04_geneDACA007102 [Acorus gramineus]|uniref:Serine/threonine-protein phosphatase 4 regulatory subunit 3-like central domain-containing protein n=1 Tax=Acorus gramineus TaxID=55184 RepID=A0AAV9BMT9_ACOGR|nr:hypothetical protein QJS04_geneDACA007102 [Acorus gramineus]
MGAQGKDHGGSKSILRVKFYRLTAEGKWDDQGTGLVTVDYVERSENLGLLVFDEDNHDPLLVHCISSDDIYRRQDDTIISWRDSEFSTELALSFQEATGCSYIWDHICGVRRNLLFSTLNNVESGPRLAAEVLPTSGALQSNDDTYHVVSSELRELPQVELSSLHLLLKTVVEGVEGGVVDQMRVTELILKDQYFFPKLIDLFRISEDLENFDALHMLFKLVKGIILLNNSQIYDKIFRDEFFLDIIGTLEYDPEVPKVQRHRDFLKKHVVFKQAIPIKDAIVSSKIHQTYWIGYLKDVILQRDEAIIANLNAIIHANNAVIVSWLKDDTTFIQELFRQMRSSATPADSKRNLVLFLQEFCNLTKSLQLVQQLRLFRDLVNEGIFDIITNMLQSEDKKLVLTGTDILILFLNQDPNFLRTYVFHQEGNVLLGLLVKGMITDFGEDMHCQFLEIVRCLLDPYTLSGLQRDTIIDVFFEKHLDQLIDVITSSCPSKVAGKSGDSGGNIGTCAFVKPEILLNICDLLCFCVLHHPYRIKCSFLLNNVIEKVLYLTRRRERYLVVAAVRFLRTIISRNPVRQTWQAIQLPVAAPTHNDEFLFHHVIKNNLLKPVVEAFIKNGNRYNLLHSAILELFEYIRKENLKALIIYVVESFWEEISKFGYLSSIQAFKLKYEQSLESAESRNTISFDDSRKRIDDCAVEKEEEDYFNEHSDEEDSTSVRVSRPRCQHTQPVLPNGTGNSHSSSSKLVDYDDDEDDADYNPPPRIKPGTSAEENETENVSNLKQRPLSSLKGNNKELELTKKRRTECTLSSNTTSKVATTHSTHNRSDSPSRKGPGPSPQCSIDSSGDPVEDPGGNESTVSRKISNGVPEAADSRPPNGQDLQSEKAVNSTDANVSEPHSV